MKKYLLPALLCLSMLWLPCFAQYDLIAIFADPAHSECTYTQESGAQVLTFYVFHYSATGAAGSRFKAPYRDCMLEMIYGYDRTPFSSTTGDSQSGVTILYGACRSGWTHILTILYFDFESLGSLPCCEYPVLPLAHPAPGAIEVQGCDGQWRDAAIAPITINGNATCPCSIPSAIPDWRSSWGRIKSLYGNE